MDGASAPVAAGDGPKRLRQPRLLRPSGGRALAGGSGGAAGRCAVGGSGDPRIAEGPAAASRGDSSVRRVGNGLGPRRQLPALRRPGAQPCGVECLRRAAVLLGGSAMVPSVRRLHPLSGLLLARRRAARRATFRGGGLGDLRRRSCGLLHARLVRRSAAKHLHSLAGGGVGRTADP